MKQISWKKGTCFFLAFAICFSVIMPCCGQTPVQAATVFAPDAPEAGIGNVPGQKGAVLTPDIQAVGVKDTLAWDGSVDVSWYDTAEEQAQREFHLTTPAQLAGLAAIVNGGWVSAEVTPEMITGDLSVFKYTKDENYSLTGAAGGNQADTVYLSDKSNDFTGKIIYLDADMDMGGVYDEAAGTWCGPNWAPIGGRNPMNTTDKEGDIHVVISHFNGTLEGNGHKISNLYCSRYTPKGYAYAYGTGFIGSIGDYSDYESCPASYAPAVRNLVIESGYVYGRRNVAGLAGTIGEGTVVENCANKAEVRCTDSRGIAGIAAESDGRSVIRNCYNAGEISTTYRTPAGGIMGSNGGTDLYNCYNIGVIDGSYGRSIGSHGSGSYTVANCYYKKGLDGEEGSDGYYEGTAVAISVDVKELPSEAAMQGPAFAGMLNANGSAFTAKEGEYPKLYFESDDYGGKKDTVCNIAVEEAGNGTVKAVFTDNDGKVVSVPEGSKAAVPYRAVVTLQPQEDSGYALGSYLVNGNTIRSDFYLVTEDTVFSVVFKKLEKGALAYGADTSCTLYASKSGKFSEDGELAEKNDVQIFPGEDVLYSGDELTAIAVLKKGAEPENADEEYTGAFRYTFTYADDEEANKNNQNTTGTHTVKAAIDGSTLTISAEPKTQHKLWTSLADTSWYDGHAADAEYTIDTPEELAGLAYLVNIKGVTFAGKTVKLGESISLKNNDGTTGSRYWSGIGTSSTKSFQGTFDGCGHTIGGMEANSGSEAGLFAYCNGAKIENLTVQGTVTAENGYAAGIAVFASATAITNCVNESVVEAGSSRGGGIAGSLTNGSVVSGCVNRSKVTGASYVGGIAGESTEKENRIENCANYGTVIATAGGYTYAGGIVGRQAGAVIGCCNLGEVNSSGQYAGGISGYASSTGTVSVIITSCYNRGGVMALNVAGGLVGYARNAEMKNCYSSGQVAVDDESRICGAAAGQIYRGSYRDVSQVFGLEGSCSYKYTTDNASAGGIIPDENLNDVSVEWKSVEEMENPEFIRELDGTSGRYQAVEEGYPCLAWESEPGRKLCTVRFTGDYEGEETVYTGGDVVLPFPSEPDLAYAFTDGDGNVFSGKNITEDVTITVTEQEAVYYVTFWADGKKVARVEANLLSEDTTDEPEIPELAGYEGSWSDYRSNPLFTNADIAAYAEYTRKEGTVAIGGQTLESGEYCLAANASGTVTVASGAEAVLDGEGIQHRNLAIIVEKGANLTLCNVQIKSLEKGLTLKGGNILTVEGINSVTCSGQKEKFNENPNISIEGNVQFQGSGMLSALPYESCTALSVADGCTFTQQSGTLKLMKTSRFSGVSGGVAFAPKASIVINGGIFSSVSHSDNLEAVFAENFTQNGGLVYAASLDTSVPIAIYTAENGIHLNGGSLKAETRQHTTGDVGDENAGSYHYNAEVIYSGAINEIEYKDSAQMVPSRPVLTTEMKPLSGYAFFAAYNVGESAQVKVDGEEYYNGGTYPFGFDADAEVYTDSKADQSLYFYLKPSAKTITINGTGYAVSAGSNQPEENPPGKPSDPPNPPGLQNPSQPIVTEKPAKPGNVSSFKLKSTESASQKLTWKTVKGATGYRIIRYSSAGKKQKTYTTKLTSLTVRGLKAATTYKYRISAYTKNTEGTTYGNTSGYLTVSTAPAKVKVSKAVIKASKSSAMMTVKWKKGKGSGYQVQCSTDKKFKSKKNIRTYTVKSIKTTSKKLTKLKKDKKYYVRVRAYRTLNKKKYYGAWSAVKTGR